MIRPSGFGLMDQFAMEYIQSGPPHSATTTLVLDVMFGWDVVELRYLFGARIEHWR